MPIERISSHVLDIAIGRPAVGLPAVLERFEGDAGWLAIGGGTTDEDGRIAVLNTAIQAGGRFRLTYHTNEYFDTVHGTVFYPEISLQVNLVDTRSHYHLPVLLGTYSFSSYLGS